MSEGRASSLGSPTIIPDYCLAWPTKIRAHVAITDGQRRVPFRSVLPWPSTSKTGPGAGHGRISVTRALKGRLARKPPVPARLPLASSTGSQRRRARLGSSSHLCHRRAA